MLGCPRSHYPHHANVEYSVIAETSPYKGEVETKKVNHLCTIRFKVSPALIATKLFVQLWRSNFLDGKRKQ